MTVGSGLAPDLLDPPFRKALAGSRRRRIPPVGTFTPPWERCKRAWMAENNQGRNHTGSHAGLRWHYRTEIHLGEASPLEILQRRSEW